MKKYFLHNGIEQSGPFDLEDLKTKTITRETPIWYEGLEEWSIAGKIDELTPIFSSIPPPLQTFSSNSTAQKINTIQKEEVFDDERSKIFGFKKNTFLIILGVLVLTIGGIFFNNFQESQREKRENQNKQTEIENHQKELEEQNAKLAAEQKRVESERIEREKQQAKEMRISEISEQLTVDYDKLEIAKQKLNDVTGFKLLRTASERNQQINEAQNNIDNIKDEIRELETQMKELNSN